MNPEVTVRAKNRHSNIWSEINCQLEERIKRKASRAQAGTPRGVSPVFGELRYFAPEYPTLTVNADDFTGLRHAAYHLR